ncbi:anti-sigma B factor antagonist [Streptomyces sp. TLI_235]|nr:STAS domain-containing protein [Streptomyces sp. TLI_235]PBC76255.1 anti-sigma B factor antagonist [Streptomyces sp. TLI_235]
MPVPAPHTEAGIASVSRQFPGRRTVVALRGELDLHSAGRLEPRLLPLLERGGGGELVLDLAGVTFCDSSGVELFLRLNGRCAADASVVLRAIPRQPSRVIRLMGVDRALRCEFGHERR